MIRRLFSGRINSITVAAILVASSSLVSRVLGLFRDRILAGEFGAGDTLDIYYAAFRIPDLVFNLLVLGALSAGFIPVITALIKDHECKKSYPLKKSPNREAWELASTMINVLGVVLICLSLAGIFFAPWLMKLIAPGFSPEKQAFTASLTRIMFLSPIFLGISSVLGGILQSFKRFFVYSLSPIMYNIGIIIGAIYFVPIWGIYGLAWGVVFGASLHMAVQLPAVIKLGYRYLPIFDLKNKNIREIGMLMVPRTMSLAISQINLVVITIIASTLASGSLAIFNFANNLQSFPVGIFGISFAIAAFPSLSAVAFKKKQLIAEFSRTIRQILFFVIPASVLLLALRAQIIRVILGTGQFNWEDTLLTMNTLAFFTFSLFAQAGVPLMIRMFYARHNSLAPFLIGLGSALVNVVLSLWLSRFMGVAGLALAFSIASIVNFLVLWIVLHFDLKSLDGLRVIYSTVKFTAAAMAAGTAVQGMKWAVEPYIDMTKVWGVLAQGAIAGLAGISAYILICSVLKSEELFSFWGSIKRRLPWRKVATGDQGEARGI